MEELTLEFSQRKEGCLEQTGVVLSKPKEQPAQAEL